MSATIKPPNECKNSKKKQPNASSDFEAQAYKSHPRRRSCPSRTAAQKRHRRHPIQGGVPALQPLQPSQGPPQKRRRLQRADAKKSYQQMLEEPFNVIKISGQDPPTSMSPPKTWTTNIKKNLPADKQTATDNHTQQVQNILEEGKFTKAQLQEMATRWGLPISLITSTAATPKTLQQLVSAVTLLAV